jgi:hypothetical protein
MQGLGDAIKSVTDIVLYRHLKPNGEVFYIGIGKKDRPKSKKRSKWWKKIVNKYGYEIQILKKDLTWEEACELEKILISYYGRLDIGTGTLVNMTNGGNGTLGFKPTKETRKKISESGKGRKLVFTDEWRKNLSIAGKGRKLSKESRYKILENNKLRKPVLINNVNYFSISEASRKLNISRASIINGVFEKKRKKILINNIEYNTIKEAAEKLNIKRTTLFYKIKNNLIDFKKI